MSQLHFLPSPVGAWFVSDFPATRISNPEICFRHQSLRSRNLSSSFRSRSTPPHLRGQLPRRSPVSKAPPYGLRRQRIDAQVSRAKRKSSIRPRIKDFIMLSIVFGRSQIEHSTTRVPADTRDVEANELPKFSIERIALHAL